MIYNPAARLHQILLDAGLPVSYCRMEGQDKTTIQLEWSSGPTAGQQASANTIITAFDPSEAAHLIWLENRNPDRKALADAAQQALADNATFLALGTPSNAQVLAQVRALTRQVNQLIRRLVQL